MARAGHDGVAEAARAARVPFVILSRCNPDLPVSTCTVDHAQAGRIALERLLQLRDPLVKHARLVWSPRLIARGSCAEAPR